MTAVTASFFSDFWHDQLVANSRQGLFLVLVGFLGSFGFIRLSTRLMRSPRVPWWPGSVVSDGGVHIHHLVFGIVLMLGAGTLGFWFFDTTPGLEICAALFGIGAGLTIDEFAMLIYLDDVYWAREGRASIDATVIAAVAMGLILLGFHPFETVLGAVALLALVVACFAKQRIWHGAIGFFVFPVAIYGLCRIGKPRSPWARWRYGDRHPAKQAKAEARFPPDRRTERFKERFRDAVGGSTGDVFEAKVADRAGREAAAAEVRRRADEVAD